jgi:TRAP-type C4-dicarboxylate transport system permease large subunit
VKTDQAWCLIVAGSASALMIPPGYLPVVAGLAYEVSIILLLLALLLPGVIVLAVYLSLATYISMQKPSSVALPPPLIRPRILNLWRNFEGIGWQMTLPIIILMFVAAGILTPTEFAGVVVSGAFLIAWAQAVRPRINDIIIAFTRAAAVTVEFCLNIIAGSLVIRFVLTMGWQDLLTSMAEKLPSSLTIILTLLLLPLILAFWLNSIISILLMAPFYPIIVETGISANHGVLLIIFASMIGAALRAWLLPPPIISAQFQHNRLLLMLPWFIALLCIWILVLLIPSLVQWPVDSLGF